MKVTQTNACGMTVKLCPDEAAAIARACEKRAYYSEDADAVRFLETAASLLRLAHVASLLDGERLGEVEDETKKAIAALA